MQAWYYYHSAFEIDIHINKWLPYLVVFVLGAFAGAIGYVIVEYFREKKSFKQRIECAECDYGLLQKEWEITINTQMHFNDLIVRFRSIVLSVYLALAGIIYGYAKQADLKRGDFYELLILPITMWVTAFVLDYFYYQKLLQGSVDHAVKFDENDELKSKGLFGLTSRISERVPISLAKALIWIFYGVPLFALLILIILFKKS